jgi:quaternary ammonium compound-resistance protein SugE
MAWFVLFLAGLCEVSWAVGLKYTDGFSRIWPTAGTLAAMALSVALLGLTLRWLPLGTAYAVWTGVAMVGTALLGIVLFGESADLFRILCISVIMAGIVGLKLVSTH